MSSITSRSWRRGPLGPAREPSSSLLVDVGEHLDGLLVGEVEVPEHLVAQHDRDTQERLHGRVVRGEPVAVRVLAEIRQPDRLGLDDEQAQDAVAFGQVTDPLACLVVDAHRDELGQPRAALVEHAQGAVLGVHQVDRRTDDAPQHGRQVEVAPHRHDRVEELPEAPRPCELDHDPGKRTPP
jgi:hypothetical protein